MERAFFQGITQVRHQLIEEMEVVIGSKAATQYLVGLEEMSHISTGMAAADAATTVVV